MDDLDLAALRRALDAALVAGEDTSEIRQKIAVAERLSGDAVAIDASLSRLAAASQRARINARAEAIALHARLRLENLLAPLALPATGTTP